MLIKLIKVGLAAGCLAALTTGCVEKSARISPSSAPLTPECSLPASKLASEAFREARKTLSNQECRYQFEPIFNSLLQISSGDPDPVNKDRFSDLVGWARNDGIISTVQAKEMFTRYFHHNYVSLPDDYQACAYCTQLNRIKADLRDELRQKELGLGKVAMDKAGITKARTDYKSIEIVLSATCRACGGSEI